MTTFNWSTLTNGQSITFNPAVDVLNIDDATISAGSIGQPNFTASNSGTVTITFAGKTVTLSSPLAAITTTNVTFANGSQLLVGDNTTSVGGGGLNDDAGNTLNGTAGDDAFFGLGGADTLNGAAGNDTFFTAFGTSGFGNDTIDGGAGFDTLNYNTNSTLPTSVNLSDVTVAGVAAHTATSAQGTMSLTSIETVIGTAGADRFVGGDAAHVIDSLGNVTTERFRGNAGNDTIIGGADTGFSGFFTVADYANNSNAQAITVDLRLGTANDGRGGTDTLTNVDGVRGGAAGDTLTGGSLARGTTGIFFELFRGNAGNDTIDGGNSFSDGEGASIDRADYGNNTAAQAINVNLVTGFVTDGLGGTDTLIGIEQVYGGAGNDTFLGGDNDDNFDGGAGNDGINGGLGHDVASFGQSTAGVIVNLSAGLITVGATNVAAGTANDGMGGTDTLTSIETVRGSDFADHFRGSDDVNVLEVFRGGAGNDTIDGGAGIDFASYASNALVLGGVTAFIENGSGSVADRMGGTDILTNIEGLTGTHTDDKLSGGLGEQWFRGIGGNDTIDGGAGNDGVTYSTDLKGVTVDLVTGIATDGYDGPTGLLALGGVDALISIENVEGSEFNDTIIGGSGANLLIGLDGADTIKGGGGADEIEGGLGADVLEGGANNDTLQGGDGDDRLTGRFGSDLIVGGAGAADRFVTAFVETSFNITGVAGAYTFTSLINGDVTQVNEVEEYELGGVVVSTPANLTFTPFGGSTPTDDIIVTSAVNDQIDGQDGSDTIYSLDGHDQVKGGLGNDVIITGAGRDTGLGGDGNDFVFTGDDADAISGGGGDDVLAGEGGNDVIFADAGVDYLIGGMGTNLMVGGADMDIFQSSGISDVMYGGTDEAGTTTGSAVTFNYFYILAGAATPVAYGDNAIDIFVDASGASNSADTFYGNGGQDYFFGNGGNDTAFGGSGDDVLFGDAGNDVLTGGTGIDYATGGAGNDRFDVSVADGVMLINDFVGGGTDDTVNLIGTGLTSFTQVQSALVATGSGMILVVDGDTQVWFLGLNSLSLTASDFTFV